MYINRTQTVSEMSLSGVRFEVSIAAINSCRMKFCVYTVKSLRLYHHCHHSCTSYYKETSCFCVQKLALNTRSWRWGRRCYCKHIILFLLSLLQVGQKTRTINDFFTVQSLWSLAHFEIAHNKLFKNFNTNTCYKI